MALLHSLRDTNQRLALSLNTLISRPGQAIVATPEDIGALLSELLRAGAALRAEPIPPKGSDSELDIELEKYRNQVERLRDLLPSIHRELLAERARIEFQHSRVQSAAAWARASRQTL